MGQQAAAPRGRRRRAAQCLQCTCTCGVYAVHMQCTRSAREVCAVCMQCMRSVQHLEAEDVEQSDVAALTHACRGDECRVDERHDLVEDPRVQRCRERVTRARGLTRRVGLAVGRLGARREELLVQAHARRLHAYAVHNYMHMHMHMHTQLLCMCMLGYYNPLARLLHPLTGGYPRHRSRRPLPCATPPRCALATTCSICNHKLQQSSPISYQKSTVAIIFIYTSSMS